MVQQSNTLLLPTGRVGVEDACSGIRSILGCLFAGTFLSAIFFKFSEAKDLSKKMKSKARELETMLTGFLKDVGAETRLADD